MRFSFSVTVNIWALFSASIVTALISSPTAWATPDETDLRQSLITANQAQLVMLAEAALIERDLAIDLARELNTLRTSSTLSENYLDLEADLIAEIGPDASNIHIGRSRNDLGATMNRMVLRARLLDLLDTLSDTRTAIVNLAETHSNVIVPGFTHAVQAQPTTLGHILLSLDAHLARDQSRFEEAYARLNLSPLGSAAITGSGFAIDRARLAELLGFEGLVINTYDAIVVATADSKLELTQTAGLSANVVGRFAQHLLFQYGDPSPGLALKAEASGRSSIMPQKRNPSSIERLRIAASEVTGLSTTALLYAHNTPMHEVRDTRAPLFEKTDSTLMATRDMYLALTLVLEALHVDAPSLKQRVDADYSTMSELADLLHRRHDVAFRDGYRFASALTSHGRGLDKTPGELSIAEARAIFSRLFDRDLPMNEGEFRAAFDARSMINDRLGLGGPSPDSMAQMIALARADIRASKAFTAQKRRALHAAQEMLETGLSKLAID